jgi:acetyl-CoA carboxylase biotin carboxylase subunit
MIGKLIVHGADRAEAVDRLRDALDSFVVGGVPTTIDLHRRIVRHQDFIDNNFHTRWLEQVLLADGQ